MKRTLSTLVLLALVAGSTPVIAGGYDTPILYSARHMGMGGTAIGYVNDPSALFHNPAGLAHTKFISITGDFSPLMGGITASPENPTYTPNALNVESETVFAPFFLLGAGFRVTDWLTLGVGAYPVASAAASYKYKKSEEVTWEDMTKLVFIEVAPGLAIDLPWNLRFGASYRATIIQFDRVKGVDGSYLDIHLSGVNWAGFKLGLQWQPVKWLQAGITYRHKTVTEVNADSSSIVNSYGETSMEFTLPSKLGVGVRADLGPVGLAADVEYGFNSQNVKSVIVADDPDPDKTDPELNSQFRWQDSWTLRGGVEYRVLPKLFKLRTGYVLDGQVSNPTYPSAFGTPPAPTHSITGGVGSEFTLGGVGMEVNVAYAYRFGSVEVTQESIDQRPEGDDYKCEACSYAGDYEIGLHGMYVDASVYF